MPQIKKWPLILLITFNTLLMSAFTFYLMKLPWLAGDEKLLIWTTALLQLNNREMPESDEFALINTSYDLDLIDRFDEYGFPVGNQVVTDREKLAQLLKVINTSSKKPEHVIIDIHFVDSTAQDKSLAKEMEKLDKLILSAHINDEGVLEEPLFNKVDYGLSDYTLGSIFEGVYKYQLFHSDSVKLLPLRVYEDLYDVEAVKYGPFVRVGNHFTMNNFIMNYRLLQKDIYNPEVGFNPINLGELLILPDENVMEFLEDKIVVIGDFYENDMHESIFEITAGPLILMNAYLNIKNKDTLINFSFLLLMLVVYACLSFMVFYKGDFIEQMINKHFSKRFSKIFVGFSGYFIPLILLSLLTFYFYHVHINVFFIALAFFAEDWLIKKLYNKEKLPS